MTNGKTREEAEATIGKMMNASPVIAAKAKAIYE